MICGNQIVFFCCFSWYFRGVEDSGENCVRSVLVVLVEKTMAAGKTTTAMADISQQTSRQFSHRQVLHKFVDVWHEEFQRFL